MTDFEEWYRHAHPKVVAALAIAGSDLSLVEDAADEAFARAVARWGRVQRMSNRTGWVYRVARNEMSKAYRRRGRETLTAEAAGAVWEPRSLTDASVWRAVSRLPERQREAIALRYIVDLTQDQVADAMGVRPGTAAATLHAARTTLRQRLQQQEIS